MVESVSVKVMCASEEDRLGSFGVRARKMCSDSEEDSSFLLLGRREFNFCQTTACLIPLKGAGREVSNTDSVNGCYFNNINSLPQGARRN